MQIVNCNNFSISRGLPHFLIAEILKHPGYQLQSCHLWWDGDCLPDFFNLDRAWADPETVATKEQIHRTPKQSKYLHLYPSSYTFLQLYVLLKNVLYKNSLSFILVFIIKIVKYYFKIFKQDMPSAKLKCGPCRLQ